MLMSALTISANCQTILTNYQAYRLDSLCRSAAFKSYSVSRLKEIKEEAIEVDSRVSVTKSLYLQYQNSLDASKREGSIPYQLKNEYNEAKSNFESASAAQDKLIKEINDLKHDLKVDPYDPSRYYGLNKLRDLDKDEKYRMIYYSSYNRSVGFKYVNGEFIIVEVSIGRY